MLIALTLPAQAMPLEPVQYPDAPLGTLEVHMTFRGAGRWDDGMSPEYTNFLAQRTVDMELAMVLTDLRTAPMVAIRGHDARNPEMPEAQTTIVQAVEACHGNLACQMEAVQRYGATLDATPDGLGTTEWEERYENWVSDRSRPCVIGTMSVSDSGEGSAINPPLPARPFTYTRDGTLDLATAPDDVVHRVCDAWFSLDTTAAIASIRLPAYGFWVETAYGGGFEGSERLQLIEEGPELVFSLDQSTEFNDGAWSGIFSVDNIGVATVNGGQVTAPLSATISWRFTPVWQ